MFVHVNSIFTYLQVDMTWFILKSSNLTVSSLALANMQFMSNIIKTCLINLFESY